MRQNFLIVCSILALVALPVTASSWTSNQITCDQQDLEGVWQVLVWAGDPSGNQSWDQCTLTVDPSGFVEAGGTYVDFTGESADIIGGELNIAADCVIQGTIETSDGPVYVERGGILGEGLLAFDVPE